MPKDCVAGWAINDSPVAVYSRNAAGDMVSCPIYDKWKALIYACKERDVDVTTWRRFSSFMAWWETLEVNPRDVILFPLWHLTGAPVGPETTMVVSEELYRKIKSMKRKRLDGVAYTRKKGNWITSVYIDMNDKQCTGGTFDTIEEAQAHGLKMTRNRLESVLENEHPVTQKAMQVLFSEWDTAIANKVCWASFVNRK